MIEISFDRDQFKVIVDGDIEAEFDILDHFDRYYLAFSDGTLLILNTDDGDTWTIKQRHAGASKFQINVLAEQPGETDVAALINDEGDVEWVCFGMSYGRIIEGR